MMKSSQLGETTSEVEVTNISGHGLWLLVRGSEYFLPYTDFPWFKDKTISQITNVEESSPGHFYWPDLDVDLSEKLKTIHINIPSKQKAHNQFPQRTRLTARSNLASPELIGLSTRR